MKISEIKAYPLSFRVSSAGAVRLGIGRTVKRDTVIVKIGTDEGLVGWGEAHHGRAPGSVAHLINTTLANLVMGMEATDVVGVWERVYKMQLSSHGMGAASAIALSGVDMALWDLRAKAVGWPLYRLLGGRSKPIPAYAGGISLGYQPPAQLVDEARGLVERGYRALKLRVGDSWRADVERVEAVRKALGESIEILVDANTNYTVDDARHAMPAFDALRVGWLEEPFPPHDARSYRAAAGFGSTPLAAGENHYTRFEFQRVIEDGVISVIQPDLSKTGGLTEGLRIAALASAWKLRINPHTSATGLNMAATLHFLASIDNGGYYEADASTENLFRDRLTSKACEVDPEGFVLPPEAPGLGVEIDEEFIRAHPVIEGPGYV
ncbi:mandelate racemase/muconate lactonizing enzyme family protein [Burkholderiaceae bacterium FT117]|uniref:mandelate racemase/muconate lactonizing enzyme family protein n=1 Tax=Zeimonas sediminis TaxID=2944268 RepID=UPI002342C23C|nr:mandelate racemase/muconate lactonizing enzyme family protein [Zeimonas sediminis]MCM5570441.1 mandelate racemase/muconate lactonizing enzyme family protein [Zeimonas sediminis]